MDITDFTKKTGSATNEHLQYISMIVIVIQLPKAIELISYYGQNWFYVWLFCQGYRRLVVRFIQSRRIGECQQHVPNRQERRGNSTDRAQ